MAQCVVPPVAQLLLPSVSRGDASPAASGLLASIIHGFGSGVLPASGKAARPIEHTLHSALGRLVIAGLYRSVVMEPCTMKLQLPRATALMRL